MRIGIPAHQLLQTKTGVEAYIHGLIESLCAYTTSHTYWLFGAPPPNLRDLRAHWVPTAWPTGNPAVKVLWEQFCLPWLAARLRLDLIHSPLYVIPFAARVPTVVTVHDLTVFLFPHHFRPRDRWYKRAFIPPSLRRCVSIIADSQATRRDLLRLFDVPETKVEVVYPGIDLDFLEASANSFSEEEAEQFRHRYHLAHRYILYVGTLEPRKNIARLLEAFAQIGERTGRGYQLVIAGRPGWFYEGIERTISQLGLTPTVRFTGYVPDSDLPMLYRLADLFVYPSLYEGFGFPPLEAMACGTPVITSNVSSLPEVVGDAAVLVDPTNVEALSAAMMEVLRDPEQAEELKVRGQERARTFTWERAARETEEVYERAGRMVDDGGGDG